MMKLARVYIHRLLLRPWLMLVGNGALCLLGLYVASPSGEPHGSPVRIMTYNIEGRLVDQERLLEFLRHQQPDLLLLQEVRHGEQLQWLAEHLALPYWHFAPYQGYKVGLGILSRWPLGPAQVLAFRHSTQGKIALAAPVHLPEYTLWTCSVHLEAHKGLREKSQGVVEWGALAWRELMTATPRYRQARELRTWLASLAPGGWIVGGDFNTFPFSRVDRYVSAIFDDALRSRPWRYLTGTYWELPQVPLTPRIDFLYHSPALRIQEARVIQHKISDHYPILAIVSPGQHGAKHVASTWRR